ncbi:MAG TPA: hypothetical protein H9738_03190 [Candidatus Blautia pullistercoris]|uniref:Signal peptidase I n=1 Tax=Candidatus Blautia pullistercoris TaxID=2838499 RepID=A0A9D2AMG4_9FIRM|nr:hypothetical protein [Candidatus Blautia pullistercoris]
MSKFLKIIVNLVVIAAIAVAAALLVPPFAGVDTVMNDNTETDTNLPVGSVAYGRSTDAGDLEVGDRIIYSEGSSDYIYEITDMDASAGAYRVSDPYNRNSDEQNITIQKSVPRVVLVVPFIGYGAIALQSTEGLIVVGLGIVFLIILFILSEIWRKDRDEEEDDEEDEEDSQEEDEREDEEEEEVLSRRERRRLKKEEKRRRKMARKGIREEDEEEEETEETEETEEGLSEDQDFEETVSRENFSTEEDLDKAVEEAMSSVAAGVSKISEPEQVPDATIVMPDISSLDQENIPDEIQEVPEEIQQEEWDVPLSEETESLEEIAAEEEKPEEEMEAEAEAQEEEEPEEIPETLEEERSFNPESVPNAPTIEELLAKAQAAGDTPEVKEDKDNQVTLLDYSDIL